MSDGAKVGWAIVISIVATLIKVGIYYWIIKSAGVDIHSDVATVGAVVLALS